MVSMMKQKKRKLGGEYIAPRRQQQRRCDEYDNAAPSSPSMVVAARQRGRTPGPRRFKSQPPRKGFRVDYQPHAQATQVLPLPGEGSRGIARGDAPRIVELPCDGVETGLEADFQAPDRAVEAIQKRVVRLVDDQDHGDSGGVQANHAHDIPQLELRSKSYNVQRHIQSELVHADRAQHLPSGVISGGLLPDSNIHGGAIEGPDVGTRRVGIEQPRSGVPIQRSTTSVSNVGPVVNGGKGEANVEGSSVPSWKLRAEALLSRRPKREKLHENTSSTSVEASHRTVAFARTADAPALLRQEGSHWMDGKPGISGNVSHRLEKDITYVQTRKEQQSRLNAQERQVKEPQPTKRSVRVETTTVASPVGGDDGIGAKAMPPKKKRKEAIVWPGSSGASSNTKMREQNTTCATATLGAPESAKGICETVKQDIGMQAQPVSSISPRKDFPHDCQTAQRTRQEGGGSVPEKTAPCSSGFQFGNDKSTYLCRENQLVGNAKMIRSDKEETAPTSGTRKQDEGHHRSCLDPHGNNLPALKSSECTASCEKEKYTLRQSGGSPSVAKRQRKPIVWPTSTSTSLSSQKLQPASNPTAAVLSKGTGSFQGKSEPRHAAGRHESAVREPIVWKGSGQEAVTSGEDAVYGKQRGPASASHVKCDVDSAIGNLAQLRPSSREQFIHAARGTSSKMGKDQQEGKKYKGSLQSTVAQNSSRVVEGSELRAGNESIRNQKAFSRLKQVDDTQYATLGDVSKGSEVPENKGVPWARFDLAADKEHCKLTESNTHADDNHAVRTSSACKSPLELKGQAPNGDLVPRPQRVPSTTQKQATAPVKSGCFVPRSLETVNGSVCLAGSSGPPEPTDLGKCQESREHPDPVCTNELSEQQVDLAGASDSGSQLAVSGLDSVAEISFSDDDCVESEAQRQIGAATSEYPPDSVQTSTCTRNERPAYSDISPGMSVDVCEGVSNEPVYDTDLRSPRTPPLSSLVGSHCSQPTDNGTQPTRATAQLGIEKPQFVQDCEPASRRLPQQASRVPFGPTASTSNGPPHVRERAHSRARRDGYGPSIPVQVPANYSYSAPRPCLPRNNVEVKDSRRLTPRAGRTLDHTYALQLSDRKRDPCWDERSVHLEEYYQPLPAEDNPAQRTSFDAAGLARLPTESMERVRPRRQNPSQRAYQRDREYHKWLANRRNVNAALSHVGWADDPSTAMGSGLRGPVTRDALHHYPLVGEHPGGAKARSQVHMSDRGNVQCLPGQTGRLPGDVSARCDSRIDCHPRTKPLVSPTCAPALGSFPKPPPPPPPRSLDCQAAMPPRSDMSKKSMLHGAGKRRGGSRWDKQPSDMELPNRPHECSVSQSLWGASQGQGAHAVVHVDARYAQ